MVFALFTLLTALSEVKGIVLEIERDVGGEGFLAHVKVRNELEGEVRRLHGCDRFLLFNFGIVIQILCVNFRRQHPVSRFSLLQLLDYFLLSITDSSLHISVVSLKNTFQDLSLSNLTLHFCQLLSGLPIFAHLD